MQPRVSPRARGNPRPAPGSRWLSGTTTLVASSAGPQIRDRDPAQQLGADDERLLIDVECGTVMRGGAAPLGCRPDEGKAAGYTREKICHVFAAHGADATADIAGPNQAGRDVAHQRAQLFIINERRTQAAVVDGGART